MAKFKTVEVLHLVGGIEDQSKEIEELRQKLNRANLRTKEVEERIAGLQIRLDEMQAREDSTLIGATAMTTAFSTVSTAASTIDTGTSYAEYLMPTNYNVDAFYRPHVMTNFTGTSTSWFFGRPSVLPATRATTTYVPYSGRQINSGTTMAEPMGTPYIGGDMKMTTYKAGGDIEVFIEKFKVYCSGMNVHCSRQANVLLHSLDETTFRIITKELTELERQDVNLIIEHLKKRFMAPEGIGNLRLQFRQYKQSASQDLQSNYTELLDKAAKAFKNEPVDTIENNIIEQFITGCYNEKVRMQLIERSPGSSRRALKIAVGYTDALEYNKKLSNKVLWSTETVAAIGRGRTNYKSFRGRRGR